MCHIASNYTRRSLWVSAKGSRGARKIMAARRALIKGLLHPPRICRLTMSTLNPHAFEPDRSGIPTRWRTNHEIPSPFAGNPTFAQNATLWDQGNEVHRQSVN